jgi:predicted MFS family arabinose efflux permease
MERLRIVVAILVATIWAAVVIVAFAIAPDNPSMVTLATVVTPVMLSVVGGLFAGPLLNARRRSNGNGRAPNGH